jgi:hypothetical protein
VRVTSKIDVREARDGRRWSLFALTERTYPSRSVTVSPRRATAKLVRIMALTKAVVRSCRTTLMKVCASDAKLQIEAIGGSPAIVTALLSPRLFLSYSRPDRDIANKLATELRRRAFEGTSTQWHRPRRQFRIQAEEALFDWFEVQSSTSVYLEVRVNQ